MAVYYDPIIVPHDFAPLLGEVMERKDNLTQEEADAEYYASESAAELAAENAWLYAAENNQRYRDEVEWEESQSIFGYDL